jgi:hypothetical protein
MDQMTTYETLDDFLGIFASDRDGSADEATIFTLAQSFGATTECHRDSKKLVNEESFVDEAIKHLDVDDSECDEARKKISTALKLSSIELTDRDEPTLCSNCRNVWDRDYTD